MVKKKNILILFVIILFMICIPVYSKAAKITVGKVTNIKVSKYTTSEIIVTWKKVKNATGYKLYLYNSSKKKYEYKGKTKNNLYTINKLKIATQYKVRVRAYINDSNKDYNGSYSDILTTATKPNIVENLKVTNNGDTTINLEWDRVTRATGYKVYIYNNTTKKFEYKAITNNNSITVTGLGQSNTYKFKVRAYKIADNVKYHGAYSTEIESFTKPSQVSGMKTSSNSTTSITIAWNSLVRAEGYRVYKYNNSTKKYEYIGQTKENKFTISSLDPATGYKFKVRAFMTYNGTRYYGSYCSIYDTATYPNKVTGLKTSKTAIDSISIKWNSVKKAEGYAVYLFSERTQSYKLYKTTTDTTMKIKSLKPAKFYKIYVKSYVVINNKTYYSSASSVLSQKTLSTETCLAGIDVSSHQGVIDWQKVKNCGVDFAILRCGYGKDRTSQDDKYFSRNVKECEKLGIPYGVYIYSYALTVEDALSEADHTIRLLKGHTPTFGVWFDMEDADDFKKKNGMPSNKTLVNICITFCDKLIEKGYKTGIYASLDWFNNKISSSKLDKYPKWLAQWNDNASYSKEYALWQYSSSGKINGISGNVDMDIAYIDILNKDDKVEKE